MVVGAVIVIEAILEEKEMTTMDIEMIEDCHMKSSLNQHLVISTTQHKHWSFPWKSSLLNMNKSAFFCGFIHIY